jgi:hypothetical protein
MSHFTPLNHVNYHVNHGNLSRSLRVNDHIQLVYESRQRNEIRFAIPDAAPSEVVPGVHEGGFQLWECTLDLLKLFESVSFVDSTVCELGCGCGLPGISAPLHGAASATFQDFNSDVID